MSIKIEKEGKKPFYDKYFALYPSGRRVLLDVHDFHISVNYSVPVYIYETEHGRREVPIDIILEAAAKLVGEPNVNAWMEELPNIKAYRALERKRMEVMEAHDGKDSEDEEAVLEEIEELWWKTMSTREAEYINFTNGPCHGRILRMIDESGGLRKEKVWCGPDVTELMSRVEERAEKAGLTVEEYLKKTCHKEAE